MSNQRVVVLTDEEIEVLIAGFRNADPDCSCRKCRIGVPLLPRLKATLVQPGGITDEQLERALAVYEYVATADAPLLSLMYSKRRDGESPNRFVARRILEATLFPGDKQ